MVPTAHASLTSPASTGRVPRVSTRGRESSHANFASHTRRSKRSFRDERGNGGFFQAQAYDFNGDAPHPRLALGAQAGSYFGAEAGVTWRGETATRSKTFGTHLGIYGSIGVFALALRGTIPIVMPEVIGKQPHSWELGLSMALKIPIPLYGRLIAIR